MQRRASSACEAAFRAPARSPDGCVIRRQFAGGMQETRGGFGLAFPPERQGQAPEPRGRQTRRGFARLSIDNAEGCDLRLDAWALLELCTHDVSMGAPRANH